MTDRPRLNLVVSLPGAISAGTYGAGVLDFLMEALDAFSEARRAGDAPAHEVVLTAIGGTSAGAQTALIFASSIAYRFPSVAGLDARIDPVASRANPFFEHWVVRNDLRDYLTTRDSPMRSLLDPTNVDRVADSVLRFGIDLKPAERAWVADPLRLGVAVTNLRGMPTLYRRQAPWSDVEFARHADSLFFAVGGVGTADGSPPVSGERRLQLPGDPADKARTWSDLGEACVASGAFPGFFAARTLERPTSDYVPADLHARPPSGTPYRFCAVDGGVFTASPFDVAARLIAAGGGADRTVLLRIGSPSLPAVEGAQTADHGLLKTLSSLLSAIWEEARGRPDALDVHDRVDVHEVFVLTPHLPEIEGDAALAGSRLRGFAGYFMQEFREHDFLLGRCNAQAALAGILCLPDTDPLFSNWTPAQRQDHAVAAGSPEGLRLPIIPLVGGLRPGTKGAQTFPAWPKGSPDIEAYASALRRRIRYVLRNLHPPRKSLLMRAVCAVLGWLLVPVCAWLIARCLLAKARGELGPSPGARR